MDVDEIFKRPGLPVKKRKLEAPDPVAAYKAVALHVTAEEVQDQDEETVGDSRIGGEDIDERFFGSGLSSQQKEILDYMEDSEQDSGLQVFDSAAFKKLVLKFERAISKNAQMRAKFSEEPEKFMSSESDLDSEIKALSVLAEHSSLYKEFVESGSVASLVQLLAHENTDIAIEAVEVIDELTDETVECDEDDMKTLLTALFENQVIELLSQNLARLTESNENEKSGIFHTLGVFENLASADKLYAEYAFEKTALLQWLLARIQRKESPTSQNKQYSAEILSIMSQVSVQNRKLVVNAGGVDVLLRMLSPYRRRDPDKNDEEEEMAENLFDTLCSVSELEIGKEKLVEEEGIELLLLMLKEGKFSKARALKCIDHALGGRFGKFAGERFVEAGGLRTLFPIFMKKSDYITIEHILGIIASCLRSFDLDSSPRVRLLNKFVEKDYEKVQQLTKLRAEFAMRVERVNQLIMEEKNAADNSETEDANLLEGRWYLRRLDAGLFALQTIDLVLGWICVEDDHIKDKAKEFLQATGSNLDDVRHNLKEYLDNIGDDETDNIEEASSNAIEESELVNTLLEFL